YIFTHQIMPKEIWSPVDFIIGLDSAAAIAIFVALATNSDIAEECKLFLMNDGSLLVGSRKLGQEETAKIVNFRSRVRPVCSWAAISMFTLVDAVLMLHVAHNKMFTVTLGSFLYWPFIFSLFMFYLV